MNVECEVFKNRRTVEDRKINQDPHNNGYNNSRAQMNESHAFKATTPG